MQNTLEMEYSDGLGAAYQALASDSNSSPKAKEAAALYATADKYMYVEEQEGEAVDAATKCLEIYKEMSDKTGIADSTRMLCQLKRFQGKVQEAETMATQGLANCVAAGDKAGMAKMTITMAELKNMGTGKTDASEALKFAKEACSTFKAEGEKKMEGNALLTLCNVQIKNKDIDGALETCYDAIKIAQETGDKKIEAIAKHGLAAALSRQDKFEEALEAADEALELFRELDIKKLIGLELQTVALLHLSDEEALLAVPIAEEAYDIFVDMNSTKGEIATLQTLVRAYIENDEALDGVKVIEEALDRFKDRGDGPEVMEARCYAMLLLAQTRFSSNDSTEGMAAAEEALAFYKENKRSDFETLILQQIGQVQLQSKENQKALETAKKALAAAESMQDDSGKARAEALHLISNAQMQLADYKAAMKSITDMRAVLKKSGNKGTMDGMALLDMVNVHFQRNEIKDALSKAEEARDVFKADENPIGEAHATHDIAKAYFLDGKFEKSLQFGEQAQTMFENMANDRGEIAALLTVSQARYSIITNGNSVVLESVLEDSSADFKECLKVCKEATKLAQRVEDCRWICIAMLQVGRVNMLGNRIQEAQKNANEVERMAKKRGDLENQREASLLMAQILWSLGMKEEASEKAKDALELAKKEGLADDSYGMQHAEYIVYYIDSMIAEAAALAMPTVQVVQQEQVSSAAAGPSIDILALPPEERVKMAISGMVTGIVGTELEGDSALIESGITSITAIRLRDEIQNEFPSVLGMDLTFTFEYPTINAMTDFILGELEDA